MGDDAAKALALSAVRVTVNHNFDTAANRDSYFSTHANELKEKLWCTAGTKLYQYMSGGWKDRTILWKGTKGDTGNIPTVDIGSVTSGDISSVTKNTTSTGIALNFVLEKGDKGDKGDTGATGASGLNWRNEYLPTESYIINDAVHYTHGIIESLTGSYFCTQDADTTQPPVKNDAVNRPYWDVLSLHGAPGADGKDGVNATITVGEVITDADTTSFENVGSPSSAVWNIKIKKGDKGDTGDKGLNWREGGYDPDEIYNKDDGVSHNNKAWICLYDGTTGIEPTSTATNWDIFTDPGVQQFVGATATTDGTEGTVPKPITEDINKYLKGDGAWNDISSEPMTFKNKTVEDDTTYIVDTFAPSKKAKLDCSLISTGATRNYKFPNASGEMLLDTTINAILEKKFPVGHIEITTNSTNPSTYLGFGTWSLYGQGRTLVCYDTSSDFNSIGKTGEKKHIG